LQTPGEKMTKTVTTTTTVDDNGNTVTTTTTVETERGNSSPNQGKLPVSGDSWISKDDPAYAGLVGHWGH
jgi:hypothetical protein